MTRHKDREYTQALYDSVKQITVGEWLPWERVTAVNHSLALILETGSQRERELRKMKKFRFQLLHRWLVEQLEPCRVADIGGGKGLLAYLLQQSGWQATVIDPVPQPLPDKYKDILSDERVRVPPTAVVPHIDAPFAMEMGAQFDLLIGMHAHGSNAQIIDAAVTYGCGFVLFPCCVIDEPFFPPLGVDWVESVAGYAVQQGLAVYPFRLNFKGQNIGLCSLGRCQHRT
ncbi:MAG: hypothetical protein R3E31_15630 [Chloroflexota bacterium]|nr:hypothetical protein [Ardenticatenaceae bacterium]